MTKKRNCQHQCIARNFRNKERCKNKVRLSDEGNHMVILFRGNWAELCPLHLKKVFNYLMIRSNGEPVVTNEATCT